MSDALLTVVREEQDAATAALAALRASIDHAERCVELRGRLIDAIEAGDLGRVIEAAQALDRARDGVPGEPVDSEEAPPPAKPSPSRGASQGRRRRPSTPSTRRAKSPSRSAPVTLDPAAVLAAIRRLVEAGVPATRRAIILRLDLKPTVEPVKRAVDEAIADLERNGQVEPGPTYRRGPTFVLKAGASTGAPPGGHQISRRVQRETAREEAQGNGKPEEPVVDELRDRVRSLLTGSSLNCREIALALKTTPGRAALAVRELQDAGDVVKDGGKYHVALDA